MRAPANRCSQALAGPGAQSGLWLRAAGWQAATRR